MLISGITFPVLLTPIYTIDSQNSLTEVTVEGVPLKAMTPLQISGAKDCEDSSMSYINCDDVHDHIDAANGAFGGRMLVLHDGLSVEDWTWLESHTNIDIVKYYIDTETGPVGSSGDDNTGQFNNNQLKPKNDDHGAGILATISLFAPDIEVVFMNVQTDDDDEGYDLTKYGTWQLISDTIVPLFNIKVISVSSSVSFLTPGGNT